MITNIAQYAIPNSSVYTYRYSIAFQSVASSPISFNIGTYVTDAMRAFYGYTSTSKIVAAEFRLINVNIECPVASVMNTQCSVICTYNASNFARNGSANLGIVAPLNRTIGSVTSTLELLNPVSVFYKTLVPANYATSSFSYVVINSNTGAAISSADYVMYNFEVIEYVSAY